MRRGRCLHSRCSTRAILGIPRLQPPSLFLSFRPCSHINAVAICPLCSSLSSIFGPLHQVNPLSVPLSSRPTRRADGWNQLEVVITFVPAECTSIIKELQSPAKSSHIFDVFCRFALSAALAVASGPFVR